MLDIELTASAKRGRYTLWVHWIDGWDAGRKDIIFGDEHAIPAKPWLACSITRLASKGRGIYREKNLTMMVITHHALSRLAQRCGAKTPEDLIDAVANIWMAFAEQCEARKSVRWARTIAGSGFKSTKGLAAFAALKPYEDCESAVVVATILDTL